MNRQSGLKRIISSFVLSITLTFGMASIGYCGGAFEPLDFTSERYEGPPIHGKLVIIGGDETITLPGGQERVQAVKFMFEGSCGPNHDINSSADVSANNYWVPENLAEMSDTRYPARSKIIEGCQPATEPTENDFLKVMNVWNFEKCDAFVSADVLLMWVVPK